MPKYIVTMCRTSYQYVDIEVEGEDALDAESNAYDVAGDYTYTERSADYEVDHSREDESG